MYLSCSATATNLSIPVKLGKFLLAHKHLMDLENSRDELLYEIHRQPQQSPTNSITIRTYFKDVSPIAAKLEKKVKWKR